MRQWRLVYDYPTTGAGNMAVDAAILEAAAAGVVPPTLRLYDWTPPCLSLGYGQRVTDVDFDRAAAHGWDVVRRPTGGRAILHIDELTYSLALRADDELVIGSVVESYRKISTALTAGLQRLGVEPEADERMTGIVTGSAVCFETPSNYEITVLGRKLIGSAQVRRKGGVLQHGSLPLTGDVGRICDILSYPDELTREAAKVAVRARATTLAEARKVETGWREAAEAMGAGFSQQFDVDWIEDELTEGERARAGELAAEVYGSSTWTARR